MRYAFWAAVLIPVQWPLVFYSFVLRARFSLGWGPYPYHPDPGELGFNVHTILMLLSFLLVLISPIVLLYLLIMTFKVIKMNRLQYASAVALFAVFMTSTILLFKYDSGRFIEWFMD
ncbi:hypothetical protein L0244_33685 [bacterium]|nr:hypothetical protein [bacterium]